MQRYKSITYMYVCIYIHTHAGLKANVKSDEIWLGESQKTLEEGLMVRSPLLNNSDGIKGKIP